MKQKTWPFVWAVLTLSSMLIGAALHFALPQSDAITEFGRGVVGLSVWAIILVPLVALAEALVREIAHAKRINKTRSAVMWSAYTWVVTALVVLLLAS